MNDDLTNFLEWFLKAPVSALKPPFFAVANYGVVSSMILYRQPPYQVELFTSPPGKEGFETEHRHPNVDSYVVHLSGDIDFRVNGKSDNAKADREAPGENGASKLLGFRRRVRETDWHSATISDKGGSFLSVQKWLNGVSPSSVGMDWEGETTSPEQARLHAGAR